MKLRKGNVFTGVCLSTGSGLSQHALGQGGCVFLHALGQEVWQEDGVYPSIHRVAMTQGKQGIWFLLFQDRENTGILL